MTSQSAAVRAETDPLRRARQLQRSWEHLLAEGALGPELSPGTIASVRDDGVGGADAARGTGLVGLSDRVEALGGTLRVVSRPGDGTHITVEFPLG